jgi:MinD superfamily P-loop ATPase
LKLNVLSGKGGVGKTSVASSLASLLSRDRSVVAVDCDVDAPNLGLFFGLTGDDFEKESVSVMERAFLVPEKCTQCGRCVDACAFSAIEPGPEFNRFLCEGCGACQLVCPSGAIELRPVESGWVGVARGDFPVVGGQLKMGESGSGKMVDLIKRKADGLEHDVMVVDSAAGIGCPVIASVRGCDYVVAVTEPTPSGLSDLKRAMEVVRHFNIEAGLVVNKADLNPQALGEIREYAAGSGLPVLAEIPYDRAFVEAAVELRPPVVYKPELECMFAKIVRKVFAYG